MQWIKGLSIQNGFKHEKSFWMVMPGVARIPILYRGLGHGASSPGRTRHVTWRGLVQLESRSGLRKAFMKLGMLWF